MLGPTRRRLPIDEFLWTGAVEAQRPARSIPGHYGPTSRLRQTDANGAARRSHFHHLGHLPCHSLSVMRMSPSPVTTGPLAVSATYPSATSLLRWAVGMLGSGDVTATSISEANSSGV